MTKKSFPLSKVYQLMEASPVVLVTTSRNGKPNIMTMSWHMMLDFVPPLIAIIVGEKSHTFQTLIKTKECVINIPTAELISKAVKIGSCSGASVDKFKKFKLAQDPAQKVKAPLIRECIASLECKVIDMKLAKKYNLFIVKVVKAWAGSLQKKPRIFHHWGNGVFTITGKTVKRHFGELNARSAYNKKEFLYPQ